MPTEDETRASYGLSPTAVGKSDDAWNLQSCRGSVISSTTTCYFITAYYATLDMAAEAKT